MTTAARIIRKNGLVHIERSFDEACRRALLDGVPTSLHAKMVEALSAQVIPNAYRAQKEARKHFGPEADEMFAHAATFASDLHQFLSQRFGLDGLLDWLTATGYGNDYRMIKVFKAWSEMKAETPQPKIILNG